MVSAKGLGALVVFLLLLLAFEYWSASGGEPPTAPLATQELTFATPHPQGRVSDKFPNTILVGHDDREYRFYEDLVRDRVVVVQFMYTTCTGI